jgi:phage I-like protein
MKSNLLHTSIAVLNASLAEDVGIASLAFDHAADANGWCQLLPAGHFKAVDGRPIDVNGGQWFIDQRVAQNLISTALAAVNDLVIDYEHQTLNSDINGQPAPAAGWFKEIEWRDDSLSAEGSGLWIKPQWTERARDFISNGEYRFLSAVFPYDKNTGEPLALHSAALVNRPGIDGLATAALRAKHTTPPFINHSNEDQTMNEELRQLLAKLGITLAEDAALTAEQGTAALSALDALEIKANKTEALETSIAALKAAPNNIDLSMYVPAVTYNALVTEMASLKANDAKNSAKTLIKEGQENGKVLAAEVSYLNDFADQQGVVALKAMIDARPAITALKSQQTDTTEKPDTNLAVLSADEHEAIRISGMSEEDYITAKKAT